MSVVYGKLYMKDASGNLVQVIPESNSVIPDYQGATVSAAGVSGLVPAAMSSQKDMYLKGDGTWNNVNDSSIVPVNGSGTPREIHISGDASVYTTSISANSTIYFPSISSGKSKKFTIVMTYDTSSSYSVNWPNTVYWENGSQPTLTSINVITFLGINDGNTTKWFGTVSLANPSLTV